jgi:hypothetical protein
MMHGDFRSQKSSTAVVDHVSGMAACIVLLVWARAVSSTACCDTPHMQQHAPLHFYMRSCTATADNTAQTKDIHKQTPHNHSAADTHGSFTTGIWR